jgi:choloylglycine hydrolase
MFKKIIGRSIALILILSLLWMGIWLYNPIATLLSLKKINDYPLYSLQYYGDARQNLEKIGKVQALFQRLNLYSGHEERASFACSLFFSAADPADMQYGRNFDWQFSPAVVVTYQQPGGNKSISIANLQWMGFSVQRATQLHQSSILERLPLLSSPYLLTDGMNDSGVVVGMAAVPDRGELYNSNKKTAGSLQVMRLILDQATSTNDAVQILRNHNIQMDGGPAIHYLIADSNGISVVVEITHEDFFLVHPQQNYQAVTNHYLSDPSESQISCPRLETLQEVLRLKNGQLPPGEAMHLLNQVSQPSTQWSVVYHNITGQVELVTDLNYAQPLTLQLKMR